MHSRSRRARDGGLLLVLLSVSSSGAFGQHDPKKTGGLVELFRWESLTTNLVTNSSFEQVEDGTPRPWSLRQPRHWSVHETDSHSGLKSLRLSSSDQSPHTPSAMQSLELEPGWYALSGWLRADDAGSHGKGAGGRLNLQMGRRRETTSVVGGTQTWSRVEKSFIRVNSGDSPTIRLEAYRKPDGDVFFDDIEVRRLEPPPVEGFLLYPNYRGILFDDQSQLLRMSVQLNAAIPSKVRMTAVKEGDSSVVATSDVSPTTDRFVMTLDLSKAPTGSYVLGLSLPDALEDENEDDDDESDNVLEYPRYRVLKMPAGARQGLSTYIDEQNHLVRNGRTLFPLGIYDTSGYSNSPRKWAQRLDIIAEAPFNLYINYWLGRAPTRSLDALMQTLERHEMGYLHTVNRWYDADPAFAKMASCGSASAPALGETDYTLCRARELSARRAMAGWYTADERGASEAARVFQQFAALKAGWPGGVSFVALNRPFELELWRDAADAFDLHAYPIFNVPEGTSSPLHDVYHLTRQAGDALQKSRPVWTVLQAFQHGTKGHFPTYAELRSMSYLAIVGGAQGLFYWSYGAKGISWIEDPVERERHWNDLVKLTRELSSLEPALLAPDQPDVLTEAAPETIAVISKNVNGRRYVFAVNLSASTVDAWFTLGQPAASIDVSAENRSLTPRAMRFTDSFGPHEAHVYVTKDGGS